MTQVFLDLDGVLADWLTPALTLLDYDPAKVYEAWDSLSPRPWNVFEVLDVSASQAWRQINKAGESFWAHLPIKPHAHKLLRMCQAIGETTILTSPSLHKSSYAGKQVWLDRHFGKGFAHKHALIGGCKHVVARPGALLIDDSPRHCEAWTERGGDAIVFPAYGNARYRQADKPLKAIHAQLQDDALRGAMQGLLAPC